MYRLNGTRKCQRSKCYKSKKEERKTVTLGLYILSRGLHLCTLDLQISYAIVHEEDMRSIA